MEIQISQDIRKYKTKDIGNFSFKEAAIIALGAGLSAICYKFLNTSLETAAIPMVVTIVIGFFKPMGMSVPLFISTVMNELIFSPKIYVDETDEDEEENEEMEDVELYRLRVNESIKQFNELLEKARNEKKNSINGITVDEMLLTEPIPLLTEEDDLDAIFGETESIQETVAPVKYTKEELKRLIA